VPVGVVVVVVAVVARRRGVRLSRSEKRAMWA
jgi:hypothetical protein